MTHATPISNLQCAVGALGEIPRRAAWGGMAPQANTPRGERRRPDPRISGVQNARARRPLAAPRKSRCRTAPPSRPAPTSTRTTPASGASRCASQEIFPCCLLSHSHIYFIIVHAHTTARLITPGHRRRARGVRELLHRPCLAGMSTPNRQHGTLVAATVHPASREPNYDGLNVDAVDPEFTRLRQEL